jgi:hypothetical protein
MMEQHGRVVNAGWRRRAWEAEASEASSALLGAEIITVNSMVDTMRFTPR